jgi:hypothetical protein
VAERIYIAGVLANTPENLARWIENPTEINPRTAMPNLHIAKPRPATLRLTSIRSDEAPTSC